MKTRLSQWVTRASAIVFCAALGSLFSAGAAAQAWPSRPITVIYPFGTSAAEVFVRAIASEAGKSIGQPLLVENRPGAGGRVGVTAIVNGKPDGYMIGIATTSVLAYQPLTSPTFKIEPVRNYTPITQFYNLKLFLFAGTKVPFRDVKGLIEYAKANPGKLNMGTTGNASTGHFGAEMLNSLAGIKIVSIPYKGEVDMTTAALSGDIHLFLNSGGPKPHVDAARLQVIATTGDTRSTLFPDRPTMRESGLDYVLMQWMGVVAPPGLPSEIADKLNLAVRAALKEPAVMKAGELAGVDPVLDSTPEGFTSLIRSELKALEPVVKQTGIVTD